MIRRAPPIWLADVREALEEVEDYFDQRADAEYLPGQAAPVGNEEMRMLCIVREALAVLPVATIDDLPKPSSPTDIQDEGC